MDGFLSFASGAFVSLIISGGLYLLLYRRLSKPLTAILFLPAAALVLMLDRLALLWPGLPESFPYAYFLFFLPAFLLFSDTPGTVCAVAG